MLTIRFGGIVLVAGLLDPQGRNPKDRPAVIVTPDIDIEQGQLLRVVAITTRIPKPVPDDHVLLPWQLPRHPRTGLNKRCAAVGSWGAIIDRDRVIKFIGSTPSQGLKDLMEILERWK